MTASAKTLATARTIVRTLAVHGAKIDACMGELAQLKGMTFSDWEKVRVDFVAAYCEARGVDAKDKSANAAARKGWSRILAALGVEKPKSENAEAVAKRAARAKKPSTNGGRVVSPMEGGAATKKAAAVKQELTAIEAHLVSLFRRGQFKAMIDILHSEAEKAAAI